MLTKTLNRGKEFVEELIKNGDYVSVMYIFNTSQNLIKHYYGDDIHRFYNETKLQPYCIRGTVKWCNSMWIDDAIVQSLNLKDFGKNEKILGDFTYGRKNGIKYRFNARLHAGERKGQKFWFVIGLSGDSGFGYSFISQRNTLGVTYRKQIFDQVIEKFKRNQYLYD